MKRISLLTVCGLLVLAAGCAKHKAGPTNAQMAAEIVAEAKDYPIEIAVAKNAGLPLKMADLAKPLPPADQNAATYYYALGKALKEHPLTGQDGDVLDNPGELLTPSPQRLADGEKALARHADLIRLVHQAASRRQCVFAKNWTIDDPAALSFPEMSTMEEAARLLSAQSLILAHEGKTQDAVQDASLMFSIADHAATEPMLMSYLSSVRIQVWALSDLQKILYISHGDPKIAWLIQQTVEQNWHPRSLAAAERTEVAFHQGELDFLRRHDYKTLIEFSGNADTSAIPPNWGVYGLPTWNQFMDANGAFMLKQEIRIATTSDKAYPTAKAAVDAVESDEGQTDKLSHFLAEILVVPFRNYEKRAQIQAMADSTRAGAAVLIWKAAHGAYPKKLSQAMPRVPADPIDGKPLRYRREGDGFVIYSVGRTKKFDGGLPTVKPSGFEAVFRYPMPAYLAAKN